MKIISLKSLLLIACLLGSITASAYDFKSGGIYYNITSPADKTVSVTYRDEDYNSYSGSVVIPASVTNEGKSYSVTSLGDGAFILCASLTSVTIPNSITSIEVLTFDNCTGLKEIIVASENPSYSSLDGVLFNKDKSRLIAYPNAKSLTSYSIPNSVTEIGAAAFWNCVGLTSVTIPNSVTEIDMRAFSGCNLTSITIPNSVTWIGNCAFCGCSELASVKIGNSVSLFDKLAFSECTSLTKIYNYSKEPQPIGTNVFDDFDKTKCTLYVPTGCKASYKAADVWNEFGNIQEFDPTQP